MGKLGSDLRRSLETLDLGNEKVKNKIRDEGKWGRRVEEDGDGDCFWLLGKPWNPWRAWKCLGLGL